MKGRVMGIDFGLKRLGVALTDPTQLLVRGWGTLHHGPEEALPHLQKIAEEERVVEVVVGLPTRSSGIPGTLEPQIKAWANKLQNLLQLPLHFQEEGYSSQMAGAHLRQSGAKAKQRKKKGEVDRIAACIILQNWLDEKEA